MADNYGILPQRDSFSAASTTLKNRLARLLWGWVWLIFCRFSPRPLHAWRAMFLRLFGARIGRDVHVYPRVDIWAPWNLSMEDYSCLANGVTCYSMAKISIGRKAVISQGVHLCSGTHDYTNQNFQLCAYPIAIGNDAWICAEAFVGPGVTVGEGAVVGARAVVTRDVPSWVVVAGNPCVIIKSRLRIRDAQKSV